MTRHEDHIQRAPGGMITWWRYIPYDTLLLAICDGWAPVADLGEHHGQYACLCRWHGEGEPS